MKFRIMKKTILIGALIFFFGNLNAQTISYSTLYNDTTLSATANEIILLFGNAGISGPFSKTELGTSNPSTGIVLRIDTTLITSQRVQQCDVICNGSDKLEFIASSSHGVKYGVYEYIAKLGFKFYGPDDLWNIYPNLSSPYLQIDTTYESAREYHTFFGSGGFYPCVIDPTSSIDPNSTVNLHNWNQFTLRNNMINEYEFSGHTGESYVENNLTFLQNNPCYIAEYNGLNEVIIGSTPNMFNPDAIQHWGDYIKSSYDLLPKLPTNNSRMSIEVADGTKWGNTTIDPNSCGYTAWPSASDQHFTIANTVTENFLNTIDRPFRTTCFSYAFHADTPSVAINPAIQVMVANGFQNITSNVGMLYRWKTKHDAIFEYSYLAIPDGGQTPFTNFNEMDYQAKRVNLWNTLGTIYEATSSIFASGLHLRAFHKAMMDGSDASTNFNNQLDELFGTSSVKVKELYDLWNKDEFHLTYYWQNNNFDRMPIYHKLIREADELADNQTVKNRINRLKAYFHVIALQGEMKNTTDSIQKQQKVEELLNYLVGIYNYGVINCSQQFNNILSVYASPEIFHTWVDTSATANSVFKDAPMLAQPAFTNQEIDAIFDQDSIRYPNYYEHVFLSKEEILQKACDLNLVPKDTIEFFYDIPENSVAYKVYAPGSGNIRIEYNFNTNDDWPATFVLDAENQLFSISETRNPNSSSNGFVELTIPSEGYYDFSLSFAVASNVNLKIITNGNYFFKTDPAILTNGENFAGHESSFTSYNYVPEGIDRLYFDFLGSLGDSTFINTYSTVLDGNLNQVYFHPTSNGNIYYIDVDSLSSGKFWQIYSTLNYPFSIVNTSNVPFVLQSGQCSLSVNEIENENIFKVYPNPSNGNFTIELNNANDNDHISVLDFSGRKMFTQKIKIGTIKQEIQCENLAKGVYFITLEKNNGAATSVQKIIIN
jgi:hypothetical protein